jgi:hypothetical protein
VISHQIVSSSSDGDAHGKEPLLEFAKGLLASAIGMSDQCMDGNTSRDGGSEGLFNFFLIESEDDNFNGLLG